MLIPLLIVLAIVAGLLRGGSLRNFAALPLRWIPLIIASFVLQLFLFTPFLHRPLIAVVVEPLYLLSMAMATVWVALNWRIPGMPLIALGLLMNFAAIAANGGHMPVSRDNMQYSGKIVNFADGATISNNSVLASPDQVRLWILTDIIPLPKEFPLANVFSIGDVLLVVGIGLLCYRTVRRTPEPASTNAPSSQSVG
jgi:Family of unknown function (DUF5317)